MFYWFYLKFRRPVKLKSCLTGKCWCRGAQDCFFRRCKNCDGCIDENGQHLDDAWAEEWNRCPECGGKLQPL